ncbi:unnamed protein product [Effrenium voratum]|nr:unnamed protein product [Effrenium voratum]
MAADQPVVEAVRELSQTMQWELQAVQAELRAPLALEQEAEQAVKDCGLDLVAASRSQKGLVRELKALKDSPAYSKTTARRELQNRYALSETAVRNLEKEGVETRLAEFLSHRRDCSQQAYEKREDSLSQEEQKKLAAWRQKQDSLQNKPKQRRKYQVLLAVKAGLRERTCQTIRNLSQSEVAGRVRTAWRLYDQNLYAAAQPDVQPELPVHDRESWVTHRRETGLTFSDQIPVWLLPPPSKLLTSVRRLQTAAEQRKVRQEQRKNKEPVTVEPQTKTARESPGKPPRWRVSLVARQAVSDYFAPEETPRGHILPTILVVFGSHARLENIGLDGRWIETEEFVVGEKVIRREAGEKVGGRLMCTWRKLRQERPELLHPDELRVWSQPSAMMDSVTYRWQADLERQFRQAVDCIDQFAGAWSQESQEVTDAGLGQPAKAALARFHQDLRERQRAKAKQEGVQPSYVCASADIAEAALMMHRAMTKLNEEREVVLRTARQCGWLHWRPDAEGKLQLASEQEWARPFPEGSAKLGDECLKDRGAWVVDGVPAPFTEEELSEKGEAARALELEGSYLVSQNTGEEVGFFFDLQADLCATQEEVEEIQSLLLHPRQRSEAWASAVAKTTSQVRKLRKHKSKGRQVRKKRLEQWRAAHQNQTAEKALKSVVPVVKKKKKKAAKNAAAAEVVESEKTGPLCGKSVAVVGEAAPAHLSGRTVVVQAERELEVLVEWQGQQAWVQKADLDVECKAARQDWTRSLQQDGVSLTDGQVRAGFLELLLRLTDQVSHQTCTGGSQQRWSPHWSLLAVQTGGEEWQAEPAEAQAALEAASKALEKLLSLGGKAKQQLPPKRNQAAWRGQGLGGFEHKPAEMAAKLNKWLALLQRVPSCSRRLATPYLLCHLLASHQREPQRSQRLRTGVAGTGADALGQPERQPWLHQDCQEQGQQAEAVAQTPKASASEQWASLPGAWVVDGVPAPFTEEELSEKGEAARALELEGSYLVSQNTGEEVGFFFDLQADLCATQEEVEEIQSLLLHPRQRSEAWASAVAKTTSQVRKLRKHKSKGRQVRKKRLEQWRAAHQNQTAEKALKSVVPVVKKKKKKASLKNKASAKHKPSLKQKASAKEKKKKSAKKQAAKNAAAAEVVESEKTGPLCGKSVAVVGEAAPAHLSGRTVVVQAERELEVLVEWQPGKTGPAACNKMAIRAAEIMGSEPVETVQAGVSLTDGQVRAGFLELLLRLTDQVEPPDVHWWEPAAVVAGEKPVWLQPVLSSEVSQLVLVPVQSSPPEHWSLLAVQTGGEEWQAEYYDSLPKLPQAALEAASKALEKLLSLGGKAKQQLPPKRNQASQQDGTSCGLFCLQFAARAVRAWRGQGLGGFEHKPAEMAAKLNKWLALLQRVQAAKLLKAAGDALPPLPPPSQPPERPEEVVKEECNCIAQKLTCMEWRNAAWQLETDTLCNLSSDASRHVAQAETASERAKVRRQQWLQSLRQAGPPFSWCLLCLQP